MAQKTRTRGPPRVNGATNNPQLSKGTANAPFPGLSDARVTSIFAHLIGHQVTVTTRKYAPVSGLFHRTDTMQGNSGSPNYTFVLKYAREVEGKGERGRLNRLRDARGGVVPEYWISARDVVMIVADGVKPDALPPGGQEKGIGRGKGMLTDGEISGIAGRRAGRKLKKFDDFSGDMRNMSLRGLESSGTRAGKWDQFAVNQEKFGVTTSFDEHQYTTRLDRNSENFAEREKKAESLATEIMKQRTQNVHLREERGQAIEGVDEEEMYGKVNKQTPAAVKRTIQEPHQKATLSYAAAVSGSRSASTNSSAALKREEKRPHPSGSGDSKAGSASAAYPKTSPNTGAKSKKSREATPPVKSSTIVRSPTLTGRTSPNRGLDSPSLIPAKESTAVATLNIEAQTPRIGPEAIKSFQNFKADKLVQGVVENRKHITLDLWKFKDRLDIKEARRASSKEKSSSSNKPGGSPLVPQVQERSDSSARKVLSKGKESTTSPQAEERPSSGGKSHVEPKKDQKLPGPSEIHLEQEKCLVSPQASQPSVPSDRTTQKQDVALDSEKQPPAGSGKVESTTTDHCSPKGLDESEKSSSMETQGSSAQTKPRTKPKFKFNPAAKNFTPKSMRTASQPSSTHSSPSHAPQQGPPVPMQPGMMVPPGYNPDFGPVPQYSMPAMPYGGPPVGYGAPIGMGPRPAVPYQYYNGMNRFGPGSPSPGGMPPFAYAAQPSMAPNPYFPQGVPMNQYSYPPAQPYLPQQRFPPTPPQHHHRAGPPHQYYVAPPVYSQGMPHGHGHGHGHGHDRMSNGRGRGRGRAQHNRSNNSRGYHHHGQPQYHHNRHSTGDSPFQQRGQTHTGQQPKQGQGYQTSNPQNLNKPAATHSVKGDSKATTPEESSQKQN